jgi:NitT/TauT family transport system substrate-binding protein
MESRHSMRLPSLAMVVVLAAGLPRAPAAAAEALRVGKSTTQGFSYTLVDVGIRAGIFQKHGLAVTPSSFGGGPRLLQAMAADAIDIGLDGGTDMAMIVKGAPIMTVAPLSGPPVEIVITVRANSPLKSADDLKGKKIAVTGLGTLTGWLTRELARSKGWGGDGINLVLSSTISASRALLKTGDVDGVTTDVASTLEGERRGEERLLYSFGDLVKDFHMQVFFATNKLIVSRPAAVRAFLAGWFETVAFAKANKQRTVEIEQEVLGFHPGVLAKVYDRVVGHLSSDGRFDPKALAVLSRSYVELKLLDKEPEMSKLYTNAFVPK